MSLPCSAGKGRRESDARQNTVVEIISAAGFEKFFGRLTELTAKGQFDPPTVATLAAEYGAELDFASVPPLGGHAWVRSPGRLTAPLDLISRRRLVRGVLLPSDY